MLITNVFHEYMECIYKLIGLVREIVEPVKNWLKKYVPASIKMIRENH